MNRSKSAKSCESVREVIDDSGNIVMNADYEFSGPELFDYIKGETQEQMNRASFDSYAASGFVPTVNTTRTAQNESLCEFSEAENSEMEPEKSKSTMNANLEPESQSEKTESCTRKAPLASQKTNNLLHMESKKLSMAGEVKNPSVLQPKELSQANCNEAHTVRRDTGLTNKDETPTSAEQNPAIKKQKLEGVKTRQIPCTEMFSVPHKARVDVMVQRKPKMTMTRPKEPNFETSQHVRSVKIRSSDELEEEMVKIPKFVAQQFNRKQQIFEALTWNVENSTVALLETSPLNHQWKLHLTTPKTPLLQTSLRAQPLKIKSSEELEIEDLMKAPKFQARPLNKKILESKGELGLFCNIKRQVTIPQEFHFAIDERIPPRRTANVAELFDKTVLCIEPHNKKLIPRSTAPHPFHLQTEERGAWKESISVIEVINKEIEEERARIPKANPCPCTTDCPVAPRKPEPRQCTKPEPFRLKSLVRHEENIQREMEKRRRMEEEEASMRVFKAQPILKEDPIPVPEKARKPLTEVQQFNLHVEQRAMVRAEFDKKMKEKEMMCKRCQDEAEAAKMMEEENALKQLRRKMVPHARPMPDFNQPFLPQKSSKGVTKPKSPRLKVLERMVGRRRRMMIVAAATSTAASNMR